MPAANNKRHLAVDVQMSLANSLGVYCMLGNIKYEPRNRVACLHPDNFNIVAALCVTKACWCAGALYDYIDSSTGVLFIINSSSLESHGIPYHFMS